MPKKIPNSDSVSIREVYTLIDSAAEKIMTSMLRLEGKLDSLESGRLSTIERKLANFEGRMMMIPLIITIAMNVFFFIVQTIIGKGLIK